MQLACTHWNGPVYWFGRTDTLSGASESRASARRVGEDAHGPSPSPLHPIAIRVLWNDERGSCLFGTIDQWERGRTRRKKIYASESLALPAAILGNLGLCPSGRRWVARLFRRCHCWANLIFWTGGWRTPPRACIETRAGKSIISIQSEVWHLLGSAFGGANSDGRWQDKVATVLHRGATPSKAGGSRNA
jgi:hypothetical protein